MHQQDNRQTDVYKDVVIIGNGPSGICLSYLLAGNWPHYSGEPHPGDEMLSARLRHSFDSPESPSPEAGSKSRAQSEPLACKQQLQACFSEVATSREKLELLSAGLEGRSAGRPLSLLMDQLQHPCLDAGLDVPSLLLWRSTNQHPRHQLFDHVVLGKGPPGGAWNTLDPNVLTISLSRWMSLPGLDLRQWVSSLGKDERRLKLPSYFSEKPEIGKNYNSSRVPIGIVAAYYRDYVLKQGLEKYFRCGTVVTSVKAIPDDKADGEKEYGWLVEGYENETGQAFQYRCKKVVLATGSTDSSNHLGVPGEDTYNWVTHDLKNFENKLDQIGTSLEIADHYERHKKKPKVEPVLVAGSGLSAADAIMAARFRGVPVIHLFRVNAKSDKSASQKRSLDKIQWLPASVYPEYHKVYEMMAAAADRGRNYPLYRPIPDYAVVDFSVGLDKCTRTKTRKVTLCTPQGRLVSYRLSCAAILIGSKPDLSYLQSSGIGLGKLPDKPIDSRSNPIDVDVFSSRVQKAPRKGMYAIGPLAGDNFVRFILGGAFAVLADILSESDRASASIASS